MPRLLACLRDETSLQHQELHTHPVLKNLHKGLPDRNGYISALKGFYAFYRVFEGKFINSDNPFFSQFEKGRVISDLVGDLRNCNIDPLSLPVLSPDTAPFLTAQAIGYLYLREGAALGGQVISKHLAETLSLRPGIDNKFFHGDGKQSGARWKKFILALDAWDSQDNIVADEAAKYSAALFKTLDQWLSAYAG